MLDAALDALIITATRRWYVLLFFAAYLVASLRHLGPRRVLALTAIGFLVAWASEVPSIRLGFPYGLYHYLWAPAEPRGLDPREPSLLGVPVFSDLSYVFLAYAAYCLALHILGSERRTHPALGIAAAVLFVALDVVIDPVALRGEEWFLGKIYHYPHGGSHFGVPVTNYAGWLLVGCTTLLLYQALDRRFERAGAPPPPRGSPLLGVGLYFGVCAFNIAIACSIGAREVAVAGAGVALPLAALAAARLTLLGRDPTLG